MKVPISKRTSTVAVNSDGAIYFTTLPSKDKSGHLVEPGRVLKITPDK